MIKVGFMGVPGSGKSNVAQLVAKELDSAVVIDGYAEALSSRLRIYTGPQAQYIPNLMIAFEREQRERMVDLEHKGQIKARITCGTLIDSLAYAAMKVEGYANQPKTDLTQRRMFREMAGAQLISLIIEELWRYDHVFYFPPKPASKIEVPGAEPEELGPFLIGVDEAIKTGILKWKVPAVVMEGDPAERAQTVIDTITEEEDVRDERRGDDGEAGEDRPAQPAS